MNRQQITYFRIAFFSQLEVFFQFLFVLKWGPHIMAPKRHRPFPPAEEDEIFSVDSSLIIPSFFPKARMPSTTFCCIRLKTID